VSYGFPGIGTAPHLAIEHVMREEKIEIATIPYDGAAPSITALWAACYHVRGEHVRFSPAYEGRETPGSRHHGEKRIEVVPDAPTLF